MPGWIYACTSLEAAFIRPRISKAGNAHIRSALYMPAMSAVRFDPNAKAFYETLVARRKTKLQAQVAVMRNT